jgi:peptidyl-prolyl cis-trans isomerase D
MSRGGEAKTGTPADFPFKNEILQGAFDSDVGVENQPLTPQDGYVWYEVRAVEPAKLRPLDEVKEKVKADVVAAKIREAGKTKAEELVKRAESGVSFEQLASEAKAEIKSATGLKRVESSESFDNQAVTALFSVPEGGVTWAPEGDGKSVRIIKSKAVMALPFDPKSLEATKAIDAAQKGLAADLPELYLSALEKASGVVRDEAMWQKLSGGAPVQ